MRRVDPAAAKEVSAAVVWGGGHQAWGREHRTAIAAATASRGGQPSATGSLFRGRPCLCPRHRDRRAQKQRLFRKQGPPLRQLLHVSLRKLLRIFSQETVWDCTSRATVLVEMVVWRLKTLILAKTVS